MIFVKHNVRGNYSNADGFGDEQLKHDILMSELAKLVVEKPEVVVGLLNQAGFKVSGKPGTRSLVSYVSKGLHNSQNFGELIAKEIIGLNKRLNSDGPTTGSGPSNNSGGQNWAQAAQSTASILQSLGQIFGGMSKKAKEKALAEKKRKEAEAALLAQANAIKGGSSASSDLGTGVKVLIGAAIALPIVIVGILVLK